VSFHLAPNALAFSGPGDRFQKNLAALRLAHALDASGRAATDAERLTLAHYSAFGESALLNRLFRYNQATARYVLIGDVATILSPDDARYLRAAALTAFYTPLDLIAVIWEAVLQLGLSSLARPRIIEPAGVRGHRDHHARASDGAVRHRRHAQARPTARSADRQHGG
jgi:hypothetical protein